MSQADLFENKNSLRAKLRDAVDLIGEKEAGHLLMTAKLWESQDIERAARKVNDCLNFKNRQKFDIEEIELILLEARKRDFHGPMAYLAQVLMYEVTPITPQAKIEELNQTFQSIAETTSKQLETISNQLQYIQKEFNGG